MTIIQFPGSATPRLVVSNATRPDDPPIGFAEGKLRSAISHIRDADENAVDAAIGNGQREHCFDDAIVALECALLDLLTITSHAGDDMALRHMLRARRAHRETIR